VEFIENANVILKDNSFYFKDEIRVINRNANISVDLINKNENFLYSQYYLAITYIMSKCKFIICNTGNCSLWISLFRGNSTNIFQF
jgi:hypothetical protein